MFFDESFRDDGDYSGVSNDPIPTQNARANLARLISFSRIRKRIKICVIMLCHQATLPSNIKMRFRMQVKMLLGHQARLPFPTHVKSNDLASDIHSIYSLTELFAISLELLARIYIIILSDRTSSFTIELSNLLYEIRYL